MNNFTPNKFYVRVSPGRGVFDYVPPPFDTAADALAFAAEKARENVPELAAGQNFKITISASQED
jgi:hypothetical protein